MRSSRAGVILLTKNQSPSHSDKTKTAHIERMERTRPTKDECQLLRFLRSLVNLLIRLITIYARTLHVKHPAC